MPHYSKIHQIRKRPTGRLATTTVTNELTDAINSTGFGGQHGQEDEHVSPYSGFWAEIVRTGPNGDEQDYSDERYWVQAYRPDNTEADPKNANFKWKKITVSTDDDYQIVTASNLAEGVSRGHVLPVGQPVWVDVVVDRGDPATLRFVFSVGLPMILMKITGATPVSGKSNLWSYTWVQQQYLRQGQWQDMPAGLTSGSATYGGAAYNSCEGYNTSSGVQGNSINISSLPAGFTIKAVSGGPVVPAYRVFSCDTPPVGEWIFSYENAVQGACP